MPTPSPLAWFDTHLDLACMARTGRDMYSPDLATCGGQELPAAATLPSLAAGNVKWCLATIFTEANGKDAIGYPAGDAAAARARGMEQMAVYEQWERDGWISRWGGGMKRGAGAKANAMGVGILIEGADPVTTPDELAWWVDRGVVAMGLAWARSSRYAGGNMTDEPLTDLGRAMIREMDRLGVVHDVSHLSDVALAELFTLAEKPVIASHSNCRALIDVDGERRQRHLTDETIETIGRRGGMIGVNVFSKFIIPGAKDDRRATLAEWAAHVNHICQVQRRRDRVGLGTDMDGGFSAAKMPEGIDKPADLHRLAEALAGTGWSDAEVRGFASENWLRFWRARHAALIAE